MTGGKLSDAEQRWSGWEVRSFIKNEVYPNGSIKTFSRGGSDITGALVASSINAKEYENWTDVSGVLIADPRIVANAKATKEISYAELRELSYMGASVLHEETIFPVQDLNIPIHIKNTNRPEDFGTIIANECTDCSLWQR